jgi:hypothetical protein
VAEAGQAGQTRAGLTGRALFQRLTPPLRAAIAAFRAATPDAAREQLQVAIGRATCVAQLCGLSITSPPLGYERSFRHLQPDLTATPAKIFLVEGAVSGQLVDEIAQRWAEWKTQGRRDVETIVVTPEPVGELLGRILEREPEWPPGAGATVDFA